MGGEPEPTRWPGPSREPRARAPADPLRTAWSGPAPALPALPGGDSATRWTTPAVGPAAGAPARSPFQVPRLAPGLQLGPWRLEAELGRGGMGAVWRATDALLGREVALKVLLELASEAPDARARFLREGQLAARVEHPGIVRVHAVGEEPVPWLACELVRGARPLTAAAVGRPVEEGARLVVQAARALGHAHALGVVHRDVKPDNLLVGADGRVRVTDFGISTALDVERLTLTGRIMGTPAYMAPEQLEGTRALHGPWTDVWALGVVLYEVLTGQRPFRGGSAMEVAARVLTGGADFPRPRSLRPELSPALEAVVLGALALEPGRRWHDGEAFAEALERALAGQAEPPPGRGPRRALGLGLALVATACAWALTRSGPPPTPPGVPDLPATEPGPPAREPGPVSEPRPAAPSAAPDGGVARPDATAPVEPPEVAAVWSRSVAISWDGRGPEAAEGLAPFGPVELVQDDRQLIFGTRGASSLGVRFRIDPGATWARAHLDHFATRIRNGPRLAWLVVEVNGEVVDPRHAPWNDVPLDLTRWIRPGENELRLTLHRDSDNAYWLRRIELRQGSGEPPPVPPHRPR